MDEVLEELILLRKELNAIGINFKQAVWKLNSVEGMPDAHIWQAMIVVLRDKLELALIQIKKKSKWLRRYMVPKIISGKSLIGALNYNENKVKVEKGELIYENGYAKNLYQLSFNDKLQRLTDLALGWSETSYF